MNQRLAGKERKTQSTLNHSVQQQDPDSSEEPGTEQRGLWLGRRPEAGERDPGVKNNTALILRAWSFKGQRRLKGSGRWGSYICVDRSCIIIISVCFRSTGSKEARTHADFFLFLIFQRESLHIVEFFALSLTSYISLQVRVQDSVFSQLSLIPGVDKKCKIPPHYCICHFLHSSTQTYRISGNWRNLPDQLAKASKFGKWMLNIVLCNLWLISRTRSQTLLRNISGTHRHYFYVYLEICNILCRGMGLKFG